MKTSFPFRATALVAALGAVVSLSAHAASSPLPPEQHLGSATYVSGGVGEGEAQRFEAAFRNYPLVVQLFENSGKRDEYTAEATVRITDAKGHTVLDRRADGPFMLVRLPAGEYHVGASLKGRELAEQTVHVTESGHAKTTFVFPHSVG